MAQFGSLSAGTDAFNYATSLMETFRAFDSDDDGQITCAELGGILRSLGYNISEQDVRAMMQQGDSNKDGLLSIQEFLDMNTNNVELGELVSILRASVNALEVHENEVVTAGELHETLCNLGIPMSLEECKNVIASMDIDGDGAVSFEDFKLIVDSLV